MGMGVRRAKKLKRDGTAKRVVPGIHLGRMPTESGTPPLSTDFSDGLQSEPIVPDPDIRYMTDSIARAQDVLLGITERIVDPFMDSNPLPRISTFR